MRPPCSECGADVPKSTRRPRDTCSPPCARARSIRRKREAREWKRKSAEADTANAAYLRDEFGPWSRGEGWPKGGAQ